MVIFNNRGATLLSLVIEKVPQNGRFIGADDLSDRFFDSLPNPFVAKDVIQPVEGENQIVFTLEPGQEYKMHLQPGDQLKVLELLGDPGLECVVVPGRSLILVTSALRHSTPHNSATALIIIPPKQCVDQVRKEYEEDGQGAE